MSLKGMTAPILRLCDKRDNRNPTNNTTCIQLCKLLFFSPELNCFLPVFSYFGQAAFVKKRPFLWAVESV